MMRGAADARGRRLSTHNVRGLGCKPCRVPESRLKARTPCPTRPPPAACAGRPAEAELFGGGGLRVEADGEPQLQHGEAPRLFAPEQISAMVLEQLKVRHGRVGWL